MSDRRRTLPTLFLLLALLTPLFVSATPTQAQHSTRYIVQSSSTDVAAALVASAGGTVTHRLAIIDAVGATLSQQAFTRLQASGRVILHADTSVRTADDTTVAPEAVGPEGTANAENTDTLAGAQGSAPGSHENPNGNEMANSSQETNTAGYLLYPAAATGAVQLRQQQAGLASTPNLRCQNQRVVDRGGTSQQEVLGWGVTVAVIDSGFAPLQNANQWTSYDPATRTLYAENNEGRCLVYRDFVSSASSTPAGLVRSEKANSVDENGHGTHIISTIADSRRVQLSSNSRPTSIGVAPKVNLLVARALDQNGAGSYADVIAAIDWVVQNKDRYRVRVLNLSLYAPVAGPYWVDPMNQAVMKAWQAGIVVVATAGNAGPEAGTITAPGNVPYVITVGAIKSGRYTQSRQDELATYSSRGPTESAFVKPDVVVPASRTIAAMPDDSTLARQLATLCSRNGNTDQPCVRTSGKPEYGFGKSSRQQSYYYLSGTSMAAAEVSGIVALLLQTNPQLTNDQVKWRLLSTARPNIDTTTGKPTYSPWEQGAGLVSTASAFNSKDLTAANSGMDIALDLVVTGSPQTHYWGSTIWDSTAKEFRLVNPTNSQPIAVWSGATRVWIDATRVWIDSQKVWTGATRVWIDSAKEWEGNQELWAGATRVWIDAVSSPSLSSTLSAGITETR
ncbi:MAG TPA: S8 family peptidase [Roseiflexaceae bacterium]|nr:S8 family peptidase [Roseiflexaceae bacterium]